MSISSTTRKAGPYLGNGVTVAFPFVFKVFSASDVRVVLTNPSGYESVLAIGTSYTVTLNANQDANPGGTVTALSAPETDYRLTITSALPNLQPVVLTNMGGFYPAVINDALDRSEIQIQQLAETLSRAPIVPVGAGLTNITIEPPGAGEYLRWNLTGTGIDAVPAVYDLGNFLQSGAGAVTRTAQSKMGEAVSVKDFGAAGNGGTDDTAAIQAAIDSLSSGGLILFPPGIYIISNDLHPTYCLRQKTGQTWMGAGRGATTLKLKATVSAISSIIETEANSENYTISDLCIDGNRAEITPIGGDLYTSFHMIVGADGGKHGTYKNLLLKNSWGRTLQTGKEGGIAKAENIVVDNVVVLNSGTKAISATKTIGCVIKNCYAEVDTYSALENPAGVAATSGSCFESNDSSYLLMSGCVGKQVGALKAPGIRLINGSSDIKVSRCTVSEATYLGFIQNVNDVEFSNCTGENVTNGFIVTDSDPAQPLDPCKRIVIAKNKIDQYDAAVLISAQKSGYDSFVEVYIYDNVFIGDSSYGIYNSGVIAPATGGLCEVYEWRNTFVGTVLNGKIGGAEGYKIRPKPYEGYRIVEQSSVAVSLTGTTAETILKTILLPRNTLGANGRIRVTASFSYTSSANNKIGRFRFGGLQAWSGTFTTTAQNKAQVEIGNRDDFNSQIAIIPGISSGFGSTNTSVLTLAVDTMKDQPVTITSELSNSVETMTLESYCVEAFYAP